MSQTERVAKHGTVAMPAGEGTGCSGWEDNLCPESATGEEVLPAGLWQRFSELGPEGEGQGTTKRAAQVGQGRGGGGLVSKAWSKSELGHLKIKQAEECDVTTLRMGRCGQSQREGQQCPLSVPWAMHFLFSSFVHSKVIINNL